MLWEYLWAGSWITKWLYHLNWNSNDSSGNGYNGTDTNITWVWGKLGSGAASFGTSSQIITSQPFGNLVSWANGFTISYVLFGVQSNTGSWLVNGIFKASGNAYSDQFKIYLSSLTQDPNYKQQQEWFNPTTTLVDIRTSVLNRVVFSTRVFTSTSVKLYENGVLVYSATGGAASSLATTWGILLWFDNYSSDAWRHLVWCLEEVIVENRARTAAEIKKYYTYAKWMFGILDN